MPLQFLFLLKKRKLSVVTRFQCWCFLQLHGNEMTPNQLPYSLPQTNSLLTPSGVRQKVLSKRIWDGMNMKKHFGSSEVLYRSQSIVVVWGVYMDDHEKCLLHCMFFSKKEEMRGSSQIYKFQRWSRSYTVNDV